MKIKIITSLGTFTSDAITDVSLEDLKMTVNAATSGDLKNFRMPVDGCPMYFAGELLNNSVFKIIK